MECVGDQTRLMAKVHQDAQPEKKQQEEIEPSTSQRAASTVSLGSERTIFQGAGPDATDEVGPDSIEPQTAEETFPRCSLGNAGRCTRVFLEKVSLAGWSGHNKTRGTKFAIRVSNGVNVYSRMVKDGSVTLSCPISLRGRVGICLLSAPSNGSSVVGRAEIHTCGVVPGSILKVSAEGGLTFELSFQKDNSKQRPKVERPQSGLPNLAPEPAVSNSDRRLVRSGRHLAPTPDSCDDSSELSKAEWPQPVEPTEADTPRSPDTRLVVKEKGSTNHAADLAWLAAFGYNFMDPDVHCGQPIRSIVRTVDQRNTVINYNKMTFKCEEKGVVEHITYYK